MRLNGISGIIQDNMKKEFIQNAIKNGYDNNRCNGWDWILANLSELDYIFQTEEYKKCKGMKFKCMPLLIKNDVLTELETRVLETAWFCNNKRVHELEEKDKIKKLNEMGFYNIESDEKYDKKKVEFYKNNSDDFFGGITKYVGKLKWSPVDKRLMVMKSKHRRRGWWIDKDIYVKFL